MNRIGLFLLVLTAVALFSSSAAATAAPGGDNSYYFVTYYSNNVSGAPDGTIRFINDGDAGTGLYALIFVFDDSQELQECGGCWVSPDGLLSEDVKTQLTSNTLTGRVPPRGVIKVISYAVDIEEATTSDPPAPGLRGWATHIQRATATSGAYSTTEAPFADSNLSEGEYSQLFTLCEYALTLGSGQGQISCTLEDHDF
jgi:hypothetical protein